MTQDRGKENALLSVSALSRDISTRREIAQSERYCTKTNAIRNMCVREGGKEIHTGKCERNILETDLTISHWRGRTFKTVWKSPPPPPPYPWKTTITTTTTKTKTSKQQNNKEHSNKTETTEKVHCFLLQLQTMYAKGHKVLAVPILRRWKMYPNNT